MIKHISSLQNPAVKRLLLLQEKAKARKKENGFIIEGKREISLAIAGGFELSEVYYSDALHSAQDIRETLGSQNPILISLSQEVYQKVAYRSGTEGIIAFAKAKHTSLTALELPSNPLILVAEAPEKPGNIGALLRTADAAAIDAVIIANPRTDLYNPNSIRSSVGCIFTTQIAMGTTIEVIEFLKAKGVAIFNAILQDAVAYSTQDYSGPTAIVVGTEATGLTDEWRTEGINIKIPMRGKIDSMNVSVAAGILIFEATRQRG